MDELLPYTKTEVVFHSPAVGSGGYGYAMNSAIPGTILPQYSNPSIVVTLFDSTDLARNATDSLTTEPIPPRYHGHNTIAFLDGHVQDEQAVKNPPPSLYQLSQSRLKQVNLGMIIYSNDYDNALPLANQWMDELVPYTKNDTLFHSPAVQLRDPSNYGYAINSAIVGQISTNFTQATTISIFDSTVLTRNATASTTTLPNPPRYGASNTIGYLDGHVKP